MRQAARPNAQTGKASSRFLKNMKIVSFAESNKQAYSDFVAAHESGSFLQSWSWGEFQQLQNRQVIRLGIYDNELLIGTVQLLLNKVPHFPGRYLYAAYGPLLLPTVNQDLALKELLSFLRTNYPKVWFVRLEPNYSLPIAGSATVHIQPGRTLVTNLTKSEEELQADMHPKTRYNIKVAEKHLVGVIAETRASDDAVKMLTQTSNRQNYHSHPAKYYEQLITFFRDKNINSDCQVKIFRAHYNAELVATALMIDHGKTRTYLFGGSTDEHRNVMAPYALHWYAIKEAKQQSLAHYDWWGIETATGKMPGFVQFKLRWGGEQKSYPAAIDIVQHRAWYTAYKFFRYFNRLF